MEKVRYGIIGIGNQGTAYAVKIFDSGDAHRAELTAICDIKPEKMELLTLKLNNISPAKFTDYREMLDSGLCDAVLVETPHYDHPEIVIECLKRGIHVICDKPAGVFAKNVKEMNAAAEASTALYGMMFNQRTNPVYKKMREMIKTGVLGKLQRVVWTITTWFRTQSYYDSGAWRATWDGEGGGVLINQCPHQLDLLSWILGEQPTSVCGFCHYGKWHDVEVEDDVTAYMEFASGATGVFITTTGEAPGVNRFEITGTLGRLICEDDKLIYQKNEEDVIEVLKHSTEGFKRPEVTVTDITPEPLEGMQHRHLLNEFTSAILGGKPTPVDGREGLNMVELMNAIELSGWYGGRKLTLPVDEDEYLRELNAHRKISRYNAQDPDKVIDNTSSYK